MILKDIYKFLTFAEYPKQIKYIMWNEAAERYAFYGMRAILVIYMSQYLKISDHLSSALFNYFIAFAYLTPIIAAYIADKYIGKFRAIIIFSIIYAFGFLTLSLTSSLTGLLISLFLIGLGTGGIKPCISTFMGDQLNINNHNYVTLRAKAFSMFYFMINLGSIISTFITPITRQLFGPRIAFSIPAILMILSIIILLMGRKYYIHVTTNHKSIKVFKIILSAIKNIKLRKKNDIYLSGAYKDFSKQDVHTTYNLLQIIKIFAFMIIFYAVWDQQGSSWVIQALSMNNTFLGINIPPDIMQVFNPLFILILVPVCNKYIYPGLNRFFVLTPFRKIGIGIIISGVAFITLGIYQQLLDAGIKINILWQVLSYLFISIAEVLLTITFMEFAYSQAPQNMKSIIMALFWLTVFLGNILAAIVLQINIFTGAISFYFFAFLAIIIGLLFIPVSKTYKPIDI